MARTRYGSLLFLAAVASLISGAASAQIAVFPVGVEPLGFNAANSLMSTATYEARLAASSSSVANSLYYSRAVAFSEATVANGVKSRVALGPALGIAAAMLAAGYALDQLTGQITAPASNGKTDIRFSGWRCGNNYPGSGNVGLQSTPYACAVAWATNQGRWGGSYCTKFSPITWTNGAPGYYGFYPTKDNGSSCSLTAFSVWYNLAPGYTDPTSNPNVAPTPAGPATDKQVVEAIKVAPISWPEITHWPKVGQGVPAPSDNIGAPRVLTPMPQQMQQVQAQFRQDTATPLGAGEVEAPVPQAEETTAPAAPVPTGSTDAPPAPSVGISFPVFCTWAEKVCTFVDWMNAPDTDAPSDAMPEKQITAATWDSGLGGGSCPAPVTTTLSGRTQTMTYQPLCDLATGIKPFLLIVAALGAALILARG